MTERPALGAEKLTSIRPSRARRRSADEAARARPASEATAYPWDGAGNLKQGPNAARVFTWDGENRPSTITMAAGDRARSVVSFRTARTGRGGRGRPRRHRTRRARTTRRRPTVISFGPDMERKMEPVCAAVPAGAMRITWTKYPHPDVKRVGSGAAVATYYLHRDGLNTVRLVTNAEAAGSRSSRPTRPTASGRRRRRRGNDRGDQGLHRRAGGPGGRPGLPQRPALRPGDRPVYFAGLVGSDTAGGRDQPVCVFGQRSNQPERCVTGHAANFALGAIIGDVPTLAFSGQKGLTSLGVIFQLDVGRIRRCGRS